MEAAGSLLDGKALAATLRAELAGRVAAFVAARGRAPHLAVVLASDDPASALYVRSKGRAADEIGLRSTQRTVPASTSREDLLALVGALGADPDVDGILVQLPLPPQHDVDLVIAAIPPEKDVDGLHPLNAGRLARGDEACLVPCTPLAVLRLLEHAGVEFPGLRAVVVGRSRLVGRPAADLLSNRDATVTVCHSRTVDLPGEVARADAVVVAVGKPGVIEGAWIRPGAVVIDVGINRLADGRIVGDVEFDAARARASAITPVPGGVGPMTIACLLHNTVLAAERRAAARGP
jgi:methylenetetrahydrofolate dehydrogenase (NADP+)/methenyltetrahydrofolate cyclohydrolase